MRDIIARDLPVSRLFEQVGFVTIFTTILHFVFGVNTKDEYANALGLFIAFAVATYAVLLLLVVIAELRLRRRLSRFGRV